MQILYWAMKDGGGRRERGENEPLLGYSPTFEDIPKVISFTKTKTEFHYNRREPNREKSSFLPLPSSGKISIQALQGIRYCLCDEMGL